MAKPSIKEAHAYLTNYLKKEIFRRYRSYLILSEADLQAHVWQILSDFFSNNESEEGLHKVLNKPYIKELNIHPDLVVFKRDEPRIVIELKEKQEIKEKDAYKDYQRLLKMKDHFKPVQRCYFLYVSRYGSGKILPSKRGFFEVPIVLEDLLTTSEIKEWEDGRKQWAKYVHARKDKEK